jgi:hypothetical protein
LKKSGRWRLRPIGSLAVGTVASLGLYRAISAALLGVFRRSLWFRRRILGPVFLEGTWVGFLAHGGSHHFTVEWIDQESGETKIAGREFDASGHAYATWKSAASSVDVGNSRLTYAYSCDIFVQNSGHNGLAVFELVPRGKRKPPHVLDGYSADLTNGNKNTNREYKVSHDHIADDVALEYARSIFIAKKSPPKLA